MTHGLKRAQYITIAGCLVVISGCLVLVGWQFSIVVLKSLIPGATPVNPMTAVTFLLCGTWLALFRKKKYPSIQSFLSVVVIVFGLIHFITYLWPYDAVRMDYLLHGSKIRASGIPNLIAPNTAFVFLLSGVSMLTVRARAHSVLFVRQCFIVAGFSIVYISILGYVYQVEPAYRFGGLTAMALLSAVIFFVLNTALFLSNAEYGLSKIFSSSLDGSRFLRMGVLFVLLLPPLTGYLRLWGERAGLYSNEMGVALHTLVFAVAVFVFMALYALSENRKQLAHIKAELQLKASEKKFKTLFNSLKEGVASINYDGQVMYCNPAFGNILGYSDEEMAGKKIIDMIIPLAKREEFYVRLEARRKGYEEDYETEVIKKTGEKIWIDIKSRTLHNETGEAVAYMISINDITRQKHSMEDLEAFSGSAAHDLNAPISRIIAFIDIIGSNNLDEEQKMMLSMMDDTAKSMRQLLVDLLSYTRIGAAQLDKAVVDLNKMINEVCTVLTPKDFNGSVIVRPVPDAHGNEGAIRQVFMNLVSNAIKYSSKKDKSHVEVGYSDKSGQAVYYIKDNGVGMNPDQLAKLFTPFKRFHADFDGNGLGLPIVKRVVEKHGGTIWAESVPGQGTTFHFTLAADIEK